MPIAYVFSTGVGVGFLEMASRSGQGFSIQHHSYCIFEFNHQCVL